MEAYNELGGIWLRLKSGTVSVTWPFANIMIDQRSIILKIDFTTTLAKIIFPLYIGAKLFGFNREINIPLENVSSIERKKYIPFFADGVKIVTKNSNPEWVYFWSLHSSDRILQEVNKRRL